MFQSCQLGSVERSRSTNRTPSECFLRRSPFALSQHLDELRGNLMVGPWILTSDELAIDNHVGLEIDCAGDYISTSCLKCVGHVEIHLRVKDVVFDPLFFGCRKNSHLVAGILPALSPFFGFVLISCDERCAKLSRVGHCRDERDRAMAEQCCRLRL